MDPPARVYRVDQALKSEGHPAIRLPPYHADRNPIEIIWKNLKNLPFRKTNIETLIEEGIENIGEREWSAGWKLVRQVIPQNSFFFWWVCFMVQYIPKSQVVKIPIIWLKKMLTKTIDLINSW